MKRIDQNTVEFLQLLAPGKSRTDGRIACGMVLSGQAFAEFSDEERRIIWSRMQDFDGLIPSLYTFFEDFKYLETCAHCVKRLCGPIGISIWQTMSSIFIPSSCSAEGAVNPEVTESLIQTSESNFRRQPATDMERLESGYLQLWLYTMRHYTLMPPDPKRDDDLLAKSTRAKPDERAIYEMAELAHRLGFQSTEINAIIRSSPDHQIARSALLQARKPDRYRYDSQTFDALVDQIVSCFAKATPDQSEHHQTLLADSAMKLKARAGEPQTRTHKQDAPLLFLDRLHANVEVADNITSFFVRRCVYFAFFGKSARFSASNTSQVRDTGPNQGGGGMPLSPMFVEEDDRRISHTPASHAHLPHEGAGGGAQDRAVGVGEERHGSETQQAMQIGREDDTQRRRRRNFQIRRSPSRPVDGMDQGPMELDYPNGRNQDQIMLDQRSLPAENCILVNPQSQPGPVDQATVTTPLYHIQAEDSRSDCTRVSMDAVPLAEGPEKRAPAEDAVDREVQRVSPEPEASNISINSQATRESLDEFLAGLRRAQEEQGQLEKRLADERLHEELTLSDQPPAEETPRLDPSQSSSENRPSESVGEDATAAPNTVTNEVPAELVNLRALEPVIEETNSTPPPAKTSSEDLRVHASSAADHTPSRTAEGQVSQRHIEIQLWSLERGEWKRSDRIHIDPSDPSLMERVARKYLWKNYSLYDRNLHSLRPAQCFRAATADGSNALFVVSEHEENKLVAEGRLVKEKSLLGMASRVLDRVQDGRNTRGS